MNLRLFWQLSGVAIRSLWAHKMRSTLTMLGVIIGVGAVIVMLGIGEGAKIQVSKRITSMGTNLLIIRPGTGRRSHVRSAPVETLSAKDAEAIAKQVANIAAVAPEAGKNAQVKYFAKNTNTTILGTNEAYLSVNSFTLAEGRFIEPEDVRRRTKVAVIGATPAKELFEGASALGERIKIKGINFEVVGVLKNTDVVTRGLPGCYQGTPPWANPQENRMDQLRSAMGSKMLTGQGTHDHPLKARHVPI